MSRINSRTVLSGLLLCLSLGAISGFAAAPSAASGDSSVMNTSSFSENNTVVRWARIVGVITAQGISNPVAGIASGETPWTTTIGAAAVDLTNGEAAFFVEGLVLVGGDSSGTPGPVKTVKGSLVCNAGTADQAVIDAAAVPLDAEGDAEFKGNLEKLPPSSCANPLFLILNAPKNVWIGTAAVRTTFGLQRAESVTEFAYKTRPDPTHIWSPAFSACRKTKVE